MWESAARGRWTNKSLGDAKATRAGARLAGLLGLSLCSCFAACLVVADAASIYALGLVAIAAIYVGFAVADGRRHVIAVESAVATVFIVVATAAITGSPWLLVLGFVGHGLKDLWQHRRQS